MLQETLLEVGRTESLLETAVDKEQLRVAARHQEAIGVLKANAGRSLRRLFREAVEEPLRAGGLVDAMRLLADTIEEALPGALTEPTAAKSRSGKPRPRPTEPKRLNKAELAAMGTRLTKAPSKTTSTHETAHGSYDDAMNCTFDLKLDAFRESLKSGTTSKTRKEWAPLRFNPVNTPLGAKQCRDGLYAHRAHGYSVARGLEEEGFWEKKNRQ